MRVAVVLGAFALATSLLVCRAAYMSLADGGGLDGLFAAQNAEAVMASDKELRGSIVSSDGRDLATSLKAARIIATPYQIQNPETAAKRISREITPSTGKSRKEIEALLDARSKDGRKSGYSAVATVGPEVAKGVSDLGIEGVSFEPAAERVYPDGNLASQVIGHAGAYGAAYGGVEGRYDARLSSGEDVHLTLDAAVQRELQDSLSDSVKKYDARGALGLVMKVDDGSIVALANYPSYDNNDFSSASAELQRNRVLTDPYEPGSTLKPFTFSAALEKGATNPEETFVVPDHIRVSNRIIHDSIPHETEAMTMSNVLEESSNVGTIKIARSTGGEAIEQYLKRFGFGAKTGVDLWGEDPGDLPAHRDWSGVSIGNIPIGQGLTVTPLQLASGYAAIANGGYRITPHTIAGKGKDEKRAERLISEKTSTIVRGMLQSVIEKGTGVRARIPGYTVAGKTGTSQKVDPSTGTYGDKYYASFVGFAPASDPEYLTLIVVDEPDQSIWGETVAAPYFRKVMKFTLGYFNVPPDRRERR